MTFLRPLLVALAIAAVLAVIVVIAAGAIAAEAALHPVRRRAASNCPLLSGAECASVAVTASDGVSLRGWFFRPRANWNGAAVLVFHGVGDWRASMAGLASMLSQHGYAVLTPDLRGHGESGGICTYGVEEVKDVQAWSE